MALALIHDPEVLFVDEPTTGLDQTRRVVVWDEIRRLIHRVGSIQRGKVVAEGTPDELKPTVGTDVIVARVAATATEPNGRTKDWPRSTTSNATATSSWRPSTTPSGDQPVARALAAEQVSVRDLSLRRPTLDSVFFSVTGERIASDRTAQRTGGASPLKDHHRVSDGAPPEERPLRRQQVLWPGNAMNDALPSTAVHGRPPLHPRPDLRVDPRPAPDPTRAGGDHPGAGLPIFFFVVQTGAHRRH